jgi:hypothetical protein
MVPQQLPHFPAVVAAQALVVPQQLPHFPAVEAAQALLCGMFFRKRDVYFCFFLKRLCCGTKPGQVLAWMEEDIKYP